MAFIIYLYLFTKYIIAIAPQDQFNEENQQQASQIRKLEDELRRKEKENSQKDEEIKQLRKKLSILEVRKIGCLSSFKRGNWNAQGYLSGSRTSPMSSTLFRQ